MHRTQAMKEISAALAGQTVLNLAPSGPSGQRPGAPVAVPRTVEVPTPYPPPMVGVPSGDPAWLWGRGGYGA